jgi:serine/threonine-protein kinase
MQMCPKCSEDNSDAVNFCKACGEELMGLLGKNEILHSRYRVTKVLGCGGFGAVYLAEDIQKNNAFCAVKSMFDNPNWTVSERAQNIHSFQEEANILRSLSHQNLPKVTDVFAGGGKQYFVMEFVTGQNLKDIIDKSNVTGGIIESQVMGWMIQICDALEYLHSKHIIHRDIKPANIRFTPEGQVKLVDFGIAKVFDPGNPDRETDPMKRAATPGYAPLEQYGGGGHTDARSDIHALGATLYHLLTGKCPPDANDRAVQPTIFKPPRQINPNISHNFEQVILKAMEIKPDDRYQTVFEMRDALLGKITSTKPILQLSTNSINFGKVDKGSRTMPTAPVTISNAGTGNLTWQVTTTASFIKWRTVGNQLHVELLPVLGAHTGDIQITSNGGNDTITVKALVTPTTRNAFIGLGIVFSIALFIVLFLILQGQGPTYGYLRVHGLTPPRIDLYIDGQKMATTPIAQPISVKSGGHTVELRNPWTRKTWQKIYDFQKGETYILPVIYGYLKVQEVEPSRVDLYIDGQKVATTPIADSITVETGIHTIKLKNPQTGKTWQENHDFREGEAYILPEINLEEKVATTPIDKPTRVDSGNRTIKKYGYLKVQKVVPWADIYIDNQKVATTPIDKPLRVDAGIHTIKLKNTETKEVWEKRYDFQEGKTYVLPEVDLRTGYLKVQKVTPWADIYIDSQKVATTPIDKPIRVNTGKHTIKLENPQTGKTWQEDHDFQKGETYVLPEINLR